MKKEYVYWIFMVVFLLLPFTAAAYQFDQAQTLANSSFSAHHFAPLGQSFIPRKPALLGVTLKLSDAGGAGVGNWAKIQLRKSGIDGEIVAISEERYLEDCFNFIADPGCGLGGGNPAEITFLFAQPIMVTKGETYVMEIVVDNAGDGINVAYYSGDAYSHGGYYKQGVPYLDDLWFRTLAPSEPQILVSSHNQLRRFTLQGELLNNEAIPPGGHGEIARDIIEHPLYGTWIFNGTFQPKLSQLFEGVWSSQTMAGWSTPDNGSFGGIARDARFIYVTDGSTSQGGAAKGVVRFDVLGQLPASRYLSQFEYIDISLGLDGYLYALRNTYGDVDIIDPQTMNILRSFDLGHSSGSRGLAANAEGEIYLASWDGHLYHYSANGELLNRVMLGSNLYDIDIHVLHGLLISNRWGQIWRVNFALEIVQTFTGAEQGAFVAFAETPPPTNHCLAAGRNTRYEWIQSVSLNSVAVTSGDNHGYVQHASPALSVFKNLPNTLLLTPGFRGGAYSEYWSAWADWNHDGKFTAEEKIISTRSNSAVLTTFDVPPEAVLGPTALRVAMRFDAPPVNCGEFFYGEVEDFFVNVQQE